MHRLLDTQEEERKRIARDLHDDINQRIALLSMELEKLSEAPSASSVGRQEINKIHEQLGRINEDIQRTAHRLHPSMLEHLGLKAALQTLCEEFSREESIRVKFRARSVPERIPSNVTLCLYRVGQECLHNIARHSGAKEAEMSLSGTKDGIRLTISDQGLGFDKGALRGKKGLGIISMRERVQLVGGKVSLDTRPGGGVRVTVDVPLGRKSAR